jgi:peptidyl-tRNA hydrolase
MKYYTYVVIRDDLTFPQKIVQAAHAAQGAGENFGLPGGKVPHMVLLKAENEKELLQASKLANKNSINYHLFFEPDFDTGFTALATEPIPESDEKRSCFKIFELYR